MHCFKNLLDWCWFTPVALTSLCIIICLANIQNILPVCLSLLWVVEKHSGVEHGYILEGLLGLREKGNINAQEAAKKMHTGGLE